MKSPYRIPAEIEEYPEDNSSSPILNIKPYKPLHPIIQFIYFPFWVMRSIHRNLNDLIPVYGLCLWMLILFVSCCGLGK